MSSRADPSHGAPENMIISVDLGAHYALEDQAYWDGTAVPFAVGSRHLIAETAGKLA